MRHGISGSEKDRRIRFLLLPGANSLSHLLKCLAIGKELKKGGHEFLVGIASAYLVYLHEIGFRDFAVLPDIQETDGSALPTVEWFRRPGPIARAVKAEIALIEEYRPDRVLGVFRFTARASCRTTGVPYDSLVCGCMVPECPDTLGFEEGEPGIDVQAQNLEGFYRYAGTKLGLATDDPRIDISTDVRSVLKGETTFLWDFPEFFPLPGDRSFVHVGPVLKGKWLAMEKEDEPGNLPEKVALVTFGTCVGSPIAARRIIRALHQMGFFVFLANGGQRGLASIKESGNFANGVVSLSQVLPKARLIVTHGGQMTVFEALSHQVPVLVMPFQPEQAHSGVCLERMGCGARLIPSRPFRGNGAVYLRALSEMTDSDIADRIESLLGSECLKARLQHAGSIVDSYEGAKAVAWALGKCR